MTDPTAAEPLAGRAAPLRDDEVHVWRLALDVAPERRSALAAHLSEEERSRAARLRRERDRDRFVVGRGTVREVLATYLGTEPGGVRLRLGRFGKPELDPVAHRDPISFNVSHSDAIGLCAVAAGRALGVDLECRVAMDAPLELAASRFSPREVAALARVPEGARSDAFYDCWTRKEAYLKGTGSGLSVPLDTFDVSVAPGEPAALLEARHAPLDVARWCLYDLSPAPGYAGALAVEGGAGRVVAGCWPRGTWC